MTAWPMVALGEALSDAHVFTDGDWVESKDQDPHGDVRLIQMADVGDGRYVDKSARFLTSETATRIRCTGLEPGDLLVSRMPDPLGRCCVFPGDAKPAVTVVDVCIVRPQGDRFDSRWLMHCINSPGARRQIAQFATGTTRSRISRGNLAKVRIPLPPLPEQRRIAAILDHADALRAKRREALARLDELTQSIFIDTFGSVSDEWQQVTVADIASSEKGAIRTGPFGSQLLREEFTDSGIAVLGIDNAVSNAFEWGKPRFITEAKYRELRRYTVHPGDVLITIMGTCGRCAVVPQDVPTAINTKHLCCITVDREKVAPEFLHAYFLRHPYARKYLAKTAKGAIMAGLNMGLIKDMPIPLVPLELQEAFVARTATINSIMVQHRAALAELDALFASIQSQAFRGEL